MSSLVPGDLVFIRDTNNMGVFDIKTCHVGIVLDFPRKMSNGHIVYAPDYKHCTVLWTKSKFKPISLYMAHKLIKLEQGQKYYFYEMWRK